MGIRGLVRGQNEAIPLRGAVLCVDCECVTRGLSDQCMVCGSHSLLNLEHLLGGSQVSQRARPSGDRGLLKVEIKIQLQRIEVREFNQAVDSIAGALLPALSSGEASIHLDVEPVVANKIERMRVA